MIYGGGAGGGKSFYGVNEPLRHVDLPGFRAGIFRRTYPQIKGQGGLWDEAHESYPMFGARMREGSELDAIFPSGASIAFLHLQHEKTKYEYQGHQFAYLFFDELTHFTKSQFFYLLSRNRTTCGIKPYCRGSCNPDAGSWVAEFIGWWIDQDSGYPDPDRAGVLRYFVTEDDTYYWADTKAELMERFPAYAEIDILSVTFIPALLADNPALLAKDPSYHGKLLAQPRVERERLAKGNWKISEGAIIDSGWIKRYQMAGDNTQLIYQGRVMEIPQARFRRFATVDTAGTSKEKAREAAGDPASWSVCAIWDYYRHADRLNQYDILVLRHVWRDRVGWNDLKTRIPAVVKNWNCPLTVIENAHYGKPLHDEMRNPSRDENGQQPTGVNCTLIGPMIPGMDDTSRGAKLERAIASGFLTRLEDIGIWIPDDDTAPWVNKYVSELTGWRGLPKETSDQIDASSYAAYYAKKTSSGWGGVINA